MTVHRALLVSVLGALIALPGAALSHALLVRSEPGQRSTVTRPPARVQMWFSEPLEPAYATASVWNEKGEQVDRGDAKVDQSDPVLLSLSTPNLGPGRYTVRFRVLSVDGHIAESRYTFTVKTPAG